MTAPSATGGSPSPSATGRVYLVGAGPGDPGLITLRGVECLGRADVVLYDYLANQRLLQHAPADAEKICLGGHATGRLWTQNQINQAMLAHALEGRTVVRLKGGDPSVFGCGAQEVKALADARIPYEIVPGVSAGIAAAGYTGIPITHRDHASAVAFVTGQETREKTGSKLDFEALARFPGTLVIYMGTTTVAHWSQSLLDGGKPSQTPVAIVRRCSLPDQAVCFTTLGEVASVVLTDPPLRPPVVFVVGEVANLPGRYDWFSSRPLFGQTVLVTRPEGQASQLGDRLAEIGAEVVNGAVIEIRPILATGVADRLIEAKNEFDWIVFSSANGVREFVRLLEAGSADLRWLAGSRLAAIGAGTAAELHKYHLTPDLIPREFSAEGLLAALEDQPPATRYLLLRASRGREVLREGLQQMGGEVTQLTVYESTDRPQADPQVQRRMEQGEIDWITVTSSSIARSLDRLYGSNLRQSKLVSISPLTTQTLAELGHTVAAEATAATMEGVVAAICETV